MTDPYFDSEDYSDNSENEVSTSQEFDVPLSMAGERLDAALAKLLTDYSRSRLSQWIKDGAVLLDGKPATPRTKLQGGERIHVDIRPTEEAQSFTPEPMDLPIVYEDDHIIVINKPAGMVVHPAAGNWSGTLLNGLLHHDPRLAQVPRAGIVHRLDKETSGLMVVARTIPAQTELVRQMQARTVTRLYRAIADGQVPCDGKIDAAVGRDPHNRLRMAVVKFGGKPAVTHLRILERYPSHTYVECRLETGRTHQIRVHMREARHPLAGDPLYGNPRHVMPEEVAQTVKALGRQALHACQLTLTHPATGQEMSWRARLPDDMRAVLAALRGEHASAFTAGHDAMEDGEWDDDDDHDVEVLYVRD
ncbi:MAG: 23S rRNA pseudouridine(1911/1915/1917) synthase RluD [Paludibacterium sp.]|uniref:23S rRNA pseudouridine(1911/1915/1917) synthase RluD n=1 Tax=Paludibacterium sp. TaxID=1917523 RepID=UPI0025FD78C4|nr:23S rRNA pseudouridine(1911/1915/1917) synthase RluD [Paludibacterium sp.]MBV8045902.1 23S rRNA pseudouridine(1911/1915/1917) synthase RluD [Paludibacterium sp.]MBV8646437.1 23S rRNA pseudouridine(1911/1915/1917) synthase RluD [Paludibacterium sp.]